MAVPKKKTSKSRRDMRRAHNALKRVNVVLDATTGEYKLPHHISLTDGYYNGEQVIDPKQRSEEESPEEAA